MNEFLKLQWSSISNASYLEKQACVFIPDEVILDSYVYQNLKKRLTITKKKKLTTASKVNFVPGINYHLKSFKKSSLNEIQQGHCLSAMKLLRQNKNRYELKQSESFSLEQFERLHSKLILENALFTEEAKREWERQKIVISKLQNNLFRYGQINFLKKFQRYLHYKSFYEEKNLISMSYDETESVIDVNCIQNLLDVGSLARYSQPSLKIECTLRGRSLPDVEYSILSNSRLPVSEDGNIRQLLGDNDIDVVISSSGLKRLLDNTDLKSQWSIPVKVEMVNIHKDKKLSRKVIFIDKPLVQKNPDPLDLKYYSMRRLVKSNFCQYEAFRYPNQDTYPDEKIMDLKKTLIDVEKDNEVIKETEIAWRGKRKAEPNLTHHNANYRLWLFKKNASNITLLKNQEKNTEVRLLVRSKLDACEKIASSGKLQPVIVKPKIELQIEYGANVPTKSELSREWTSLFFRPFSTLYRARMHWRTAEVVSIENCNIQKITSEAISLYEYNPHLGLGRLNTLLNELMQIDVGNYMLVHRPKYESFLGLWAESQQHPGAMDMISEYRNCKIEDQIQTNWIPLDLNYILPIHEFQKRPPGCFNPPMQWKKGGIVKKKCKPTKSHTEMKKETKPV